MKPEQKAKQIVEAIEKEISLHGQTKQDNWDDAVRIAKLFIKEILRAEPLSPSTSPTNRYVSAKRFWEAVELQLRFIKP